MPDTIIDGKGTGYLANVNDENQLVTKSITIGNMAHHSRTHKDVYSTYNEHTIQLANTEEKVCYIENIGDNNMVFGYMLLSTNSTAGITKFEIHLGPTTVAGGTAVTPVNWNQSSSLSANTIALHSNSGATPITTVSDGNEIICMYLKPEEGHFLFEIGDSIILGKNDSILIVAETENAGDKIRCEMIFYNIN